MRLRHSENWFTHPYMCVHAVTRSHITSRAMISQASPSLKPTPQLCYRATASRAHGRAMPPSLVLELGSKESPSHPPTVLRHCVHNKRCNVLQYLYCGYGVSSPLCKTFGERRSEARNAKREPFK